MDTNVGNDMPLFKKLILNDNTFTNRILGMMMDYDASMSDALLWDYEGFGYNIKYIYKNFGEMGVENSFRTYLSNNGVKENVEFYADIFMGRDDDRILRKNKNAESKDKQNRETKGNTGRA